MLGFSGLSQTPISSLQGVVASTYTLSVTSTSYSKVDNNTLFRFNKVVKVNIATYNTVYSDLSYNYYQGKILNIGGITYSVSSSLKILQNRRLILDGSNYSITTYSINYKKIYNLPITRANFPISSGVILEQGKFKVIDGSNYTISFKDTVIRSNKRLTLDSTSFSQVNNTALLKYVKGFAVRPTVTNYSIGSGISLQFNKKISNDSVSYSFTLGDISAYRNRKLALSTSTYTTNYSSILFSNKALLPIDTGDYSTSSGILLLQNKVLELNNVNYSLSIKDIDNTHGYNTPPLSIDINSIISDIVLTEGKTMPIDTVGFDIGSGISFSYLRGKILELSNETYSIDSSLNAYYKQRVVTDNTDYSIGGSLDLIWNRHPLSITSTNYSYNINDFSFNYYHIVVELVDLDDIIILVCSNAPTVYTNIDFIQNLNHEHLVNMVIQDGYNIPYQNINTINQLISPDNINTVEIINTINQLIKE